MGAPQLRTKLPQGLDETAQKRIGFLIGRIIKYNNKLQHLNLEHTGITLEMVLVIFKSMEKAASLLAIHVSHNPFL